MYNPRASKYLESFETSGYGSQAGGGAQAGGDAVDTWRYGSPADKRKAAYGGSGSISYGGSSSRSGTSSTRVIRKGSAPELPELPTFKAPEFNKRAVRALTQKMAAPGVRTLRETVQQAMGKTYENPNVRKLTLREALQGYGTGLEKVMAGASREARSEHMAELDLQRQEQMMNFEAQTKAAMAAYQNAWQDYLKGEETVTTQSSSTEEGSPGGVNVGGRTYYATRNPYTGRMTPLM